MATASARIDVHCHSVTPAYRQGISTLGPTIRTPDWTPEAAINFMDRHGIAASIPSLSVPGTHHGDDAKARRLARRCNEEAADFVSRHPKRLGAFATLPIPDVDGAREEALHALDVLKLDGVGLLASYGMTYIGDASFDPILEILNEKSAVVLIHPNNHPSTQMIKQGVNKGIGNFLVEFLFDTTRAAINLIFSDTLDRFPNIRFILCHAGGTLPFVAWRVSEIVSRQMHLPPWNAQYPSPFLQRYAGRLTPELVLSQFRRFWYETAVAAGPQTFGSLKLVADPQRILFGTDWPYCADDMTDDMVNAIADNDMLDPTLRHAIERTNAVSLFPRFR